ncbi:MAG TPA: circularly permuted type 2 ATP-grasp protein, partial [Alphaproteobacteria bacterium]|nr:circularly permuted type 2 ATP-grasp protein [Alphaproteobacteria bacterium]
LHGVAMPGGVHLHLYAADLARGRDGVWRVLDDRTQNPSGAGYALENRVVVGRALHEAHDLCRVERLAPFVERWKDGLQRLHFSAHQPRIVLLTPGPYNETYFEHAFLAGELGITLVEGGDLTVRDRHVFLKTLGGLEPVDVILRRTDAVWTDPLELEPGSGLGVAGLVEAVRAGTVTVANALGAGAVEGAAIAALLPGLCREVLGEDLLLPGVEGRWCGGDSGWDGSELERLVVKPAFAGTGRGAVFAGALAPADRAALLAEIAADPQGFVAQERLELAVAPSWGDGRLEPRPFALRLFAAATADGYAVMPGGLTRVAHDGDPTAVSMQRGGRSKDCWVLASGRSGAVTAAQRALGARIVPRPGAEALPSRVADGLFWVGRYAERCEGMVRLARTVHERLVEGGGRGAAGELAPLLRLMAHNGMIPGDLARLGEAGPMRGLRQALEAALFEPGHPNSLRQNVMRLHRAAAAVRDRLSGDQWRIVAALAVASEGREARRDAAATLRLMEEFARDLAAFAGHSQEGMSRAPGWRFLDMGRRLERATGICAVVRAAFLAESRMPEAPALAAMLALAESAIAYRERYLSEPAAAPVLDLLLRDAANPRALAFQLAQLTQHLAALPRDPGHPAPGPEQLQLGEARALLGRADFLGRATDPMGLRRQAETLMDELAPMLPELSNRLSTAFFSHAQAAPPIRRRPAS